jgi:mannosyl-3-phosphoglycerate phosphatase
MGDSAGRQYAPVVIVKPKLPVVVFSDDLPFDARVWSESMADALALLTREHIPLVFCSTKTRAELELRQLELGISHPFIAENGAAVFVPRGYFGFDVRNATEIIGYEAVLFGKPYVEVVETLHWIAEWQGVDIIGFNDMSVEAVATDCGVSLLQARLAKLREFDEPFRLLADDPGARHRLFKALRSAHIGCTHGTRYHHAGAPVDWRAGVDLLIRLFRRAVGPVFSVGLGHELSDMALLLSVDVPLIIDGDDTGAPWSLRARVPTARLTSRHGMAGWADAIIDIVETIRVGGNPSVTAEGHSRSAPQH